MNTQQKAAIFRIAVVTLASSATLILLLSGFAGFWAGMALLGFLGLEPVFLKRGNTRELDEREIEVFHRINSMMYGMSFLYLTAACMGLYFYFMNREAIPIYCLPLVLVGYLLFMTFSHSSMLLYYYART